MSFGISTVGGPDHLDRPRVAEPREAGRPSRAFAADLAGAAEATPPPEVQAEVREAARCASRLHEMGRQLRFDPDPETGRIRVEVRDLDGNVLRRIPLVEALEVPRTGGVR